MGLSSREANKKSQRLFSCVKMAEANDLEQNLISIHVLMQRPDVKTTLIIFNTELDDFRKIICLRKLKVL